MNKFIVATFLLGILFGFAAGYYGCFLTTRPTDGGRRAYSYLENSYNSTLGLCYEHPGAKNVYWLSHDNVLASCVLQNHNREIANNISLTLGKLSVLYGLAKHPSGMLEDGRIDILMGQSNSVPPKMVSTFVLAEDYYGSQLKTEVSLDESFDDFENYTDLLVYASLVEWRKGNYSRSNDYFLEANRTWDGIGFRDKAFDESVRTRGQGSYETYKLGLFYLLAKTIGKEVSFEQELVQRVWKCQDENGGFRTHYYENGFPEDSYTNTETTSIILLANI
jgi:hypothetical protein